MSFLQQNSPLERDDRLTRCEFERRYHASPNVKKAELIEGVVYVASPARAVQHGRPHGMIMAWLGAYWTATPGIVRSQVFPGLWLSVEA